MRSRMGRFIHFSIIIVFLDEKIHPALSYFLVVFVKPSSPLFPGCPYLMSSAVAARESCFGGFDPCRLF